MEHTPPPAQGDAELRALAMELDREHRAAAMAMRRTQAGVFTIVVASGLAIMASIGGLLVAWVAEMGVVTSGMYPIFMAAWAATILIAIAVGATGWAFMRGRPWARKPLWVVAVLATPMVPAGTAFGAYLIWVLLNTAEPG